MNFRLLRSINVGHFYTNANLNLPVVLGLGDSNLTLTTIDLHILCSYIYVGLVGAYLLFIDVSLQSNRAGELRISYFQGYIPAATTVAPFSFGYALTQETKANTFFIGITVFDVTVNPSNLNYKISHNLITDTLDGLNPNI